MSQEENLVTIAKFGEPTIEIHPDALPEHIKLGWRVTEREAKASKPMPAGDMDPKPAKTSSKDA